jgi:integrase
LARPPAPPKEFRRRPLSNCPRLRKERGHGSWYYRADVGRDASTGRRREQRKGGFTTKAEADAALARVLAAVSTGEHRHDSRITVGAYLDTWLADRIADGLRPSSRVMYELYVRRDLAPALGHFRLSDLRPGHVERMLRDLRTAGRGATTIRRVHAVLRSALTSAKRSRLVAYNAATDVDLPTVHPAKVRPWEADELATFLDYSAGHRLGALYEVLAFTGLRRGEACGLR